MTDPKRLLSVVDEAGSPAYVYELDEVRANQARLRAALPEPAGLYYSLKANPHPALLREIRAGGALPEVCSPGELRAALDAGWAAADVLYTGPGKRDRDVAAALSAGVRHFSVDSPTGIEQLDTLAAGHGVVAECLLRINDDVPTPGQGLAMTGVASQFGADTSWVLARPDRFAGRAHARVTGLHLYMGSNLTEVDDLVAQFAQALRTAAVLTGALAAHGARIEVLDLGGGFGAPFARTGGPVDLGALRPRLTELFDREVPGWRAGRPRLVFETGRYLVATAGTLVAAVLDTKTSHGKQIAVLESGINHLGGMSGLRRLPPLVPHLLTVRGTDHGPEPELVETTVAGPLCTPLDTWARSVRLPRLRPGDLLAVPNVGAYGLHASLLGFLGHPAPAEAVIDRADPDRLQVSRLALTREPVNRPIPTEESSR